MIIITLFILSMLFLSGWLNVTTIKKNLELNDQREALVDKIEESLDMLDTCYGRMAHHSELPLFSDEPIVQDVVRDLKMVKNAILSIASLIVTYGTNKDDVSTDE